MASIGQKLETKGVIMTLLSLVLIGTGCEERIDPPAVNPSEGKTVEVMLDLGFADEADGYTLPAPSTTKSNAAAFNYALQPAVTMKGAESSLKPDKLYNLEIQQYDQNGNHIGGMNASDVTDHEIGSAFSQTLAANSDCQLVIVAWGKGNTSTTLGTGSLASSQTKSIKASVISKFNPSNQDHMNQMPYVLHLERVCVESNTIKSIRGEDVRLLLRRLATRLTFDWTYSYTDYALKQILLQSIPLDYKVVATSDKNDKTYPSLLDQYTTIQLTSTEIGTGKYSCWIPANVRGTNSSATSQTYRIKSNAPTGSSYVDFIAVNTIDPKKKLSYRVYLGGSESTDFNLYGSTDYNYTVKISHTDLPVNDRRVTIIDPIAASKNNNNLVPTANCFMVAPGGAFCFDPFSFSVNGNDNEENSKLKNWANESDGGIVSVKILWQTKENGDVGDPVMGIVNAENDHTNIVDIKRNDNLDLMTSPLTGKDQGRIFCRVAPNTTGGSGVISACDAKDNILWSWHIWITDYNPDRTGNFNVLEPANKRKQKYIGNSAPDQLPMMDRNLGAITGYDTIPPTPLEKSKTNGFHYQWGRKDLFPSSYSSLDLNTILGVNSTDPVKNMLNRYGPDGLKYIPCDTRTESATLRKAYQNPTIYYYKGIAWCSDSDFSSFWKPDLKTVNDPCPAGWRLPKKENFRALFKGDYLYSSGGSFHRSTLSEADLLKGQSDGGYQVTYDDKGHTTYLRLAGYLRTAENFSFVGQQANIWTADYRYSFNYGWNVNGQGYKCFSVSSDWYTSDAHTLRCIQER